MTGTIGFVTLTEMASLVGVTVTSMRTYHKRATRNRRDGVPRPGDLPVPDARFGNSPVWKRSTVEKWMAGRPGQGFGGGRPWGKDR